jgi:hypothetical protein
MDKKLDIEKVESALKRAARTAVTGAKSTRAGKLVYRESATGRFLGKATSEKAPSRPKAK